MIKYGFAILLFLQSFLPSLQAEILQINDLERIEEHLTQLDQSSLVLFDVDYTLILPSDAILRPCGQRLLRELALAFVENPAGNSIDNYPPGYLYSQIWAKAKFSLVDNKSPGLVKCLQNRGIPTLALTAAPTGRIGIIDSAADWRISCLKHAGFDFTLTSPTAQTIEFPQIWDKVSPPTFKSGVLFSAKYPKGIILKQFLDAIHWYPTKIVFVDDRMDFLQSVEMVLKIMGIDFVGLHYLAAVNFPCELDEKLAEFQFRYLVENGVWMNDMEASTMMTHLK